MNSTNKTCCNNATFPDYQIHGWTVLLGIKTCIFIASIVLNAGILVFYAAKPSRLTPFSIYLIALFISNMAYLCFSRSLAVSVEIHVWRMNFPICVFYLYSTKVVSVLPVVYHVLISLNRFWAYRFPVSYRRNHNKKAALCISFAAFCYVHVFSGSGLIIDIVHYYKLDTNRECSRYTGSMAVWSQIENTVNRFLPLLVIVSVYPFLVLKRFWPIRSSKVQSLELTFVKTAAQLSQSRIVTTDVHSREFSLGDNRVPDRLQREIVKPFLILTLSSISVVVCWLPYDVYFLCRYLLHIRLPDPMLDICGILYSFHSMLDPLMVIFCLHHRSQFRYST